MRSFIINFSLLLLCSLQGQSLKTGNFGRVPQAPLPPVNSDGLKSPSVEAPDAEQVPSPEQSPRELLRHECDILYSKSPEKAAECLELLAEALQVDLPVDPKESMINNLFGIKLVDLEYLLRLTTSYRGPTPSNLTPLLVSLGKLGLLKQSLMNDPSNIDEHNKQLQLAIIESSLNYYDALNYLTLYVAELLESQVLPENELSHLLIFNSVLQRPSMLLPGGALPAAPLDKYGVGKVVPPQVPSSELLNKAPPVNALQLGALSSSELEQFETQLMSTLHQVDALKMTMKFLENQPSTAAPALDLDSIKSKAPGKDVKPRDVDAKAPTAPRVLPAGLNDSDK